MDNKLLVVSLLQDCRVSPEEMLRRHPAFISNMSALFKGPPTGPSYLEVWPPGLESYALAYGSFFNRHFNTHPAPMRELYLLVGMQTCVCDNAPYAQAMTVLISGTTGRANQMKVTAVVAKNRSVFSARENLALNVVEALCKPQPDLTKQKKDELIGEFGARAENIVFTVLGFTFMNKFTDAIAVELEQRIADVAAGTIGKHGWTPGVHGWLLDPTSEPKPFPKRETFMQKLKRVKYIPGLLAFISNAERGVPSKRCRLERFLRSRLGHSFPVLQQVTNAALCKGLGALLVRNFDPETSLCGLPVKCLAGMMFAAHFNNSAVESAVRGMSVKFGASDADLQRARDFALDGSVFCDKFSNRQVRAMLGLFKALLPTPCQVTPQVMVFLREVDVGGTVIVELVIWVSVLEVLHRITAYCAV